MKRRRSTQQSSTASLFKDEQGFTTISMVLALLITLSLVFISAQVYRINTASAQVQDVADAAAFAAENQVSDFVLSVRLCDAVALSLSLTSLVSYGAGVAALCVPGAQGLGDSLIELGGRVAKARDAFAAQAKEVLECYQMALPFLAAARATAVTAANNVTQGGANYVGAAILVPAQGELFELATSDESLVGQTVEDAADTLKNDANAADEAARTANSIKEQAFMFDCGSAPAYCLYERANKLASLEGSDNPLYTSVDSWSFSVPLERARAYYQKRFLIETPADDSVAEQARSALRKRFYAYATHELELGYVIESDGGFNASFPHLPKNTEEMRATTLFTEAQYPITSSGDSRIMHAWEGCPAATGATSYGSISQMESGGFATCPTCGFTASSMGSVASASTSISNGFEYHYAAIVQLAEEYQKARSESDPVSEKVKNSAAKLLDAISEVASKAAQARLSAHPPGSIGAIAFVANLGSVPEGFGFLNSFSSVSGTLGTRIAVSGATLLEESSEEGRNAISSLLDGYKETGGVGGVGLVLTIWSGVLNAYSDGQDALADAIENVLGSIPLVGASGLGSWASSKFKSCMKNVGLQPAEIESLKPVLINTGHIAAASDDDIAKRYLSVKSYVVQNTSSSTDAFSTVLGGVESFIGGEVFGTDSIKIADIDLVDGGSTISIEIPIPTSVKASAQSFVQIAFSRLRDVYVQVSGVRVWE